MGGFSFSLHEAVVIFFAQPAIVTTLYAVKQCQLLCLAPLSGSTCARTGFLSFRSDRLPHHACAELCRHL